MKSCAHCGTPFQSENKRKNYCGSGCRAAATRARANAPTPLTSATNAAQGSVYAQAVKDLTEAGRLDTVLGQACLVLAARIDQNADTGTALAGAIKQLEASMASALKGAAVAASPLDELRARRDAKRGA